MVTKISSKNIDDFILFLRKIIPKFQQKVQQSQFTWISNLTDLTPPCKIELFTTDNCAIGIIFNNFEFQRENLVIKSHYLSKDEQEVIQYLQTWVNSSIWEKIPYPESKYSILPNGIQQPSFRHFIASLTPEISKIIKMREIISSSLKPTAISARMIPLGAIWYLFNVPDFNVQDWEGLIIKSRVSDTNISNNQKNQNSVDPNLSDPRNNAVKIEKKSYGCFFWPAIWLGNDFRLDVVSYVRFPEFRNIFFQDKFVGSSIFDSHRLYFTKQALIFFHAKFTEEKALEILNNLLFSIRFLTTDIKIQGLNKKQIYPVSKEELCTTVFKIEESNDSNKFPETSSMGKTGSGNRGFWLNQLLSQRPPPLSWKDDHILHMKVEEFALLISVASDKFSKFKQFYSVNNAIMELLFQSSNLIRNSEYIPGFIIAFFGLERIITMIWEAIPVEDVIAKDWSKTKAEERLLDRNWTLSLKIDFLTVIEVLSYQEFILIHKMRKLRNKLVHGGRNEDFQIGYTKATIILELCVKLIQRIDSERNILNKIHDDEIRAIIEKWNSET